MTKEQFLNDQYVSGFIQWVRDKLSNFTTHITIRKRRRNGNVPLFMMLATNINGEV